MEIQFESFSFQKDNNFTKSITIVICYFNRLNIKVFFFYDQHTKVELTYQSAIIFPGTFLK